MSTGDRRTKKKKESKGEKQIATPKKALDKYKYLTRAAKTKTAMAGTETIENTADPLSPMTTEDGSEQAGPTGSQAQQLEVGGNESSPVINTQTQAPQNKTNKDGDQHVGATSNPPGDQSNGDQSNGATANPPGTSQTQTETGELIPSLNITSEDPQMKLILQAIDKKLEFILLSNTTWKKGVEVKIAKLDERVKANTGAIAGMKGVVDFMEKVAKRTDTQTVSVGRSVDAIYAQIEIDRLQTYRSQIALEDRINSLEREHRAYNIRIQGLSPTPNQNLKQLVVDTFSPVVPGLDISTLEYVAKITASTKNSDNANAGVSDVLPDDQGVGGGTAAAKKKQPAVILLARFNDKAVRNKVYVQARKNKIKLPKNVLVREDMIKADYDAWSLAKPQMETAYKGSKMCRCRYGRLTVDSKNVAIDGLLSTEARIHEMNESVKIPITRDSILSIATFT